MSQSAVPREVEHEVTVKAPAADVHRLIAEVAAARQYVRTALSTDSRATLGHAEAYAEERR